MLSCSQDPAFALDSFKILNKCPTNPRATWVSSLTGSTVSTVLWIHNMIIYPALTAKRRCRAGLLLASCCSCSYSCWACCFAASGSIELSGIAAKSCRKARARAFALVSSSLHASTFCFLAAGSSSYKRSQMYSCRVDCYPI